MTFKEEVPEIFDVTVNLYKLNQKEYQIKNEPPHEHKPALSFYILNLSIP
jgi:hypothetical protein